MPILLGFIAGCIATAGVMRWIFRRYISRWTERIAELAERPEGRNVVVSMHELLQVDRALRDGGPDALREHLSLRTRQLTSRAAEHLHR